MINFAIDIARIPLSPLFQNSGSETPVVHVLFDQPKEIFLDLLAIYQTCYLYLISLFLFPNILLPDGVFFREFR